MLRLWLLYILLIGFPFFVSGQQSGLGWEVGTGFFIKHNPEIAFDVQQLMPFAEAKYVWQSRPRQSWARYHRYPKIQLAARAQFLGLRETTGWSFALYPSLDIPIRRKSSGAFSFVVGSGLSYHSRYYDPIGNVRNNAIGSAWNNISRFQLKYSFPFFKIGTAAVAAGFNHLSNGATQSPNRGMNSWSISLEWQNVPFKLESNKKESGEEAKPWIFKKWYWDIQWSTGIREDKTPLGPKYYVYSLQTDLVYAFDPIQRWRLGIEWERNMQLVDFYSRQWQTENRNEALQLGSSWSIYVADEFVFGPTSVTILLGYLWDSGYTGIPIYNKLAFRYYFSFGKDQNKDLYATVILKSRLATAEYIALGIGYRL